ncbi:MAG: response regulator transcription factor, partial [Bdellovibrionota bacterium]
TGRTHITDKVTAFSLGAEDYISKPFDPIELKVRVDSKLKRIQIDKDKNSMIIRGDLQINLKSHKVKIATKEKTTSVALTPLEFKILCYLAKSPDQVFTRNQILTDVWGSDAEVFDRAVDVHVCSLRNKLLELSYSIQAVPGVGYQFTEKNMAKLKKTAA